MILQQIDTATGNEKAKKQKPLTASLDGSRWGLIQLQFLPQCPLLTQLAHPTTSPPQTTLKPNHQHTER